MVFCTYCGQSFTRDEHLERHILTHTNVKPYKCFTCHMSFARRDLLQRHYTVHGKDQNQEPIPAANGMIPKSAGRTPIACSNCAKTKTKCDKKFPCSRCASRNLKCTLRPTRRTSKNASRMGMIVGPDGTTLMPAPPANPENGAPTQQTASTSPQQHPQPIKPASPKNKLGSIAEDKPLSTPVDVAHPVPPPAMINMSPIAPASFVQQPPNFPPHEELGGLSHSSSDSGSSPRFMLDWSQVQMPLGFDGIVQPNMIMNPDGPFPNPMHGMPPDALLGAMPDLAGNMGPLVTPIETPRIERTFSDLELGSSANMFHPNRNHSLTSLADHQNEMTAIVAAQDGWTVFRCTPTIPSSSCPKTARLNLEKLEQSLKNHKGWSTWSPQWEDADFAGGEHLTVMQLHESTRDKLLAITQSFLHKALDIHRDHSSHHRSPDSGRLTPMSNGASNFVLLPPARVLEYFLRSYANCFERYFPLTSRGILDANELMHCYNDRASSLLVLMMIAQGAMNIPDAESRWLTGGLTEACRISLFDLIEKNIIMAGDPIVLHAALLFTVQAAWSGDKWQMDIASGQRGMYFAMLRHSGILDYRPTPPSSTVEQRANTEQLWSEWTQNESRSRLVYSWAMADQDLALFHDTPPLFSVTEFSAPMPDADRLWQAKNAAEWSGIFEQVHEFSGGFSSVGSGARPLSLKDLFRHFLDDEMISLGIEMTPMQLRLLLHPLQAMVCQFSQLLRCFSDPLSMRSNTRSITASSTRERLEEVQSLLRRWFDLAERYLKANAMCAMMQTNLVLFHLISLNAVSDFPEIERLARRENSDGTYNQLVWLHKRCIADVEEAVYHCGQALRLIRSMPRGVRPPWWSGAVYRVGLVLWADSLVRKPNTQTVTPPGNGMVAGPAFAIDALPPDHPLIVRYLTKREGVPCVSKCDGSQLAISQSFQILQHCIEVINEGAATRLSDGIKMKFDRLAKGI